MAVAAPLGVLLLLAVSALLWLSSERGGQVVSERALRAVNAELKGALQVSRLRLSGTTVVLENLTLRDPEGAVVAEVERVELTLASLRPFARSLRLREVNVTRPRLYLVQDERGLNLLRALEAKTPSASAPDAKPSPLALAVDALHLREGRAQLQRTEGPEVRLTDLRADGAGRYDSDGQRATAKLTLEGELTRPLASALSLTVSLEGNGLGRQVVAALKTDGASADVTLSLSGDLLRAQVRELSVDPKTLAAFAGSSPLRQPLRVQGSVEKQGPVVEAHLTGRAGAAQLGLDGSVDLERGATAGLHLTGRGLNLAELFGGPGARLRGDAQLELAERLATRQTSLSVDLLVKGSGTSLRTATGEATLTVPPSTVDGQPVGPVRVVARARDGQLTLSELTATLPGLRLHGSGEGNAQRLSGSGRLEATSLAELSKTFGWFLEGGGPSLSGRGELAFQLGGPAKSPSLQLKGGFASLSVAGVAATGLSVDVQVPDVQRPLETNALLAASKLVLRGQTLSALRAQLKTRNRQLQAQVTTRGFTRSSAGAPDLVLSLDGRVDPGGLGLGVAALSLQLGEERWRLSAPTHLSFANGLAVAPLELRSGEQALRAQLREGGGRVEAKLEAQAVELSRLPTLLVDPALGLAGRLDATAQLSGPHLEVQATLRDGRVRDVKDISAKLTGSYEAETADVNVSASTSLGAVEGHLLLPLQALQRRRREKVNAQLTVRKVQLEGLARLLAPEVALEGQVDGRLTLSGTSDDPDFKVELRSSTLRYTAQAETALTVKQLTLTLDNAQARHLGAKLSVNALGGALDATARTQLTFHELFLEPMTQGELRRQRVEATLTVRGLSLPELQASGLTQVPLKGTAEGKVQLSGPLRAPVGSAQLALSGFAAGALPPAEVVVTLAANEEGLHGSAQAHRAGQKIVDVAAMFGLPLGALGNAGALAAAPLTVEGGVGPLAMEEIQRFTTPDPNIPPDELLAGDVGASVSATGTLDQLKLNLHASAERLKVGGANVGDGSLTLRYEEAQAQLSTQLHSTGGGRLALEANAKLPLTLAAMREGLPLAKAPVTATLTAKAFDVGFARGIAPSIRKLKGALDADVRVAGTLAAPSFQGDLRLKDGLISLLGFGEYRDIQLDLNATQTSYALKQLSARAGNGWLRVTLEGEREGGAFSLRGTTQSEKFPVFTDDQVLATVDHQSTVEGELSSRWVNLREVFLQRARVYLPDVRRRDLQPLDRPGDIVLVRDGEPVERKRRRQLRQAEAKAAKAQGKAPPEAPPVRRYTVRFVAPKNLWVAGSDVNLELGIADDLRIEVAEDVTAFGELRIVNGSRARADVLGRRFDFRPDSFVRFSGPIAQPFINATAQYVNDREGVTVFLSVRGQGRDITIKPSSTPPLPESEIYTLLATGRRTLKRGSGATMSAGTQAASLLTSLAAAQLKKTLAAKLPLDVLSIQAGEEGLVGAKIDVGKYVTDDLYIGYTGKFGADPLKKENSNAVRLEYQIGKRWNFELEYGDAMTGGADLLWNHEF